MPLKQNREIIIFLVGPTAIGKSEVAVRLATKINAEIISCDSMQIYKGMDIVTSQPKASFRNKVNHHMIALVPPDKEYNVSRYRKEALKRIGAIVKKGKTPLFVGGTGLYLSILVDGIFKEKPIDPDIRKRLLQQAEKSGKAGLYKRLKKIDSEAAKKIHPNDTRRIIRALEVFEATGKTISSLQKERTGLDKDFDLRIFCLNMDRPELYKRIDERVEMMFRQGLISEVKRLLKKKLSKTSRYAIGVNELAGYFNGIYGLDEAKSLMKRNSRRFAKRQLTWFRKDKRIKWINLNNTDTPTTLTKRLWKELY